MALTDSLEHLPPTAGTFNYNSTPNHFATLSLGQEATDPVFGEAVRRLTNIGAVANDDKNYGFPWVNSNGTLMFHRLVTGQLNIVSTIDGSTIYSNVPDGLGSSTEQRWAHTDPDLYYYYSGTELRSYKPSTTADVSVKNFGTTLEDQGGSLISQDRTDTYFVVKYGGTHKVWNKATGVTYTGSVATFGGGGFAGITPDGNYVTISNGSAGLGRTILLSHLINHGAQTVNTTGVHFWSCGGAHCSYVSASDGNNYAIVEASTTSTEVFAVRINIDRSGMTVDQQRADATLMIGMTAPGFEDFWHMCGVVLGSNRDWCFIATETDVDSFNEVPTGPTWQPYRQEIVAVNVLTAVVRRLAHHRSRGNLTNNYFTQPRVSASPTGNVVIWASNMNDSTPADYADLYGIANPFGATSSSPSRVDVPRSSQKVWFFR